MRATDIPLGTNFDPKLRAHVTQRDINKLVELRPGPALGLTHAAPDRAGDQER